MDQQITNSIFSHYLKCEYKAFLKINGESDTLSDYEEVELRRARDHSCRARECLVRPYGHGVCDGVSLDDVLRQCPKLACNVVLVDSDFCVHFDAVVPASPTSPSEYVPLMFVLEEKVTKDHKVTLAFSGSLLAKRQGVDLSFGRILHGQKLTNVKVRLDRLSDAIEQRMEGIARIRASSDSPRLYLDVEGVPDEDFYYLIGLLVCDQETTRCHQFWADSKDDERKIWNNFLATVAELVDFHLFHYGSYDSKFVTKMTKRYGGDARLLGSL
jgi:hypothetical protein